MTMFNARRLIAATLLLSFAFGAHAERLKDIASISGVRANQLIGYGLVVGLNGTGDQTTQTPFTLQTFNNMLSQFGIKVPPGSGNVQLKNVAAVSVHADLPAFAKPGQVIDITVSSIGNSKSLRGGSLLMTPLKGIDGNVYAIAQGNLVVGGFDAEGRDGSKITVNVPSAGRIPGGASVERAVPSGFNQGNSLTLNLNRPDFTTAKRIVDKVNELLGPGVAQAVDGGSVRVTAPMDPSQRVDYLSILENLEIDLPGRGQGHHQLAHRHHRDWPERQGLASGGDPRQFDRDHYRRPDRQPAGAVLQWSDCGGAALAGQRRAGSQADVQVRPGYHAG